jgi:hypothetical protein
VRLGQAGIEGDSLLRLFRNVAKHGEVVSSEEWVHGEKCVADGRFVAIRVTAQRGFGGPSKRWLATATGVPEGEHLKGVVGHPVVHVVPDPRKRHSPDAGQRGATGDRSDCGFHAEEIKDPIKLVADGVGSSGAVLGPPRPAVEICA